MTDVRAFFASRREAKKIRPLVAVDHHDYSGCDVGSASWLEELQREQIAWAQSPDEDDGHESTELPWWHGEYSSDPNEDVTDFSDDGGDDDADDDLG